MINENQLDIVILWKRWLRSNKHLLDYVQIPGYKFVYKNREQKRGGGVGAYLKQEVDFKTKEDLNILNTIIEQLRLEIKGKNWKFSTLLGIVCQCSWQIDKKNGMGGQNWNFAINNYADIHRNNYIGWRYKHQCKRAIKTPKIVLRRSWKRQPYSTL